MVLELLAHPLDPGPVGLDLLGELLDGDHQAGQLRDGSPAAAAAEHQAGDVDPRLRVHSAPRGKRAEPNSSMVPLSDGMPWAVTAPFTAILTDGAKPGV